jgi:hypothetical protein
MSVTTNTMSAEPEADAATEQPSGEQTTPVANDSAATGTESESAGEAGESSFNPCELEEAYGLPEGTLKDAKSEQEAFDLVRSYTDNTLLASLDEGEPAPAEEQTTKAAAKDEKPASGGNEEVDKLRAKVDKLEGYLTKQLEQEQKRVSAELVRRFNARVDSWKSAKYGTSGKRTYKQKVAVDSLGKLIADQGRVEASAGRVVAIESLADRARIWDDESFQPGVKKTAETQAPVGTPGGHRQTATNDKLPRNIHEALIRG